MAKQKTEESSQDAQENASKDTNTQSKPTKVNAGGRLPLWLMMTLIALALAWQTWEDFQRNASLQTQFAELQKKVQHQPELMLQNRQKLLALEKNMLAQAGDLDRRLAMLQKDVEDFRQEQQKRWMSLQAQMNHLAQALQSTKPDSSEALYLSQAQTLIKTAQWQLVLQQPIEGVLALLLEADKLLTHVSDPRVLLLREAIARDRQLLQAVSNADAPGAYVRMTAWMQVLTHSTPVDVLHSAHSPSGETKDAKEDPSWLKVLRKWFKVTEHAQVPLPPLSAYEKMALQLQLALLIRESQWHLVRGSYDALLATLSELKAKVKTYFDTEDEAIAHLIADITELQARFSRPHPPKELQSARALDAFLASRQAGEKP